MIGEIKVCSKCEKELPVTEFFRCSQKKTGLRPDCKCCTKKNLNRYRAENYDRLTAQVREKRNANKDEVNRKKREHRSANPEHYKQLYRKKYLENKDKINAYNKKSHQKHKKKRYEQMKEKYHTDIQYKLKLNLRRRMHKLIKRQERNGSAVRDLGCSLFEFTAYIEAKFKDGMSWDNYGKWHLDHIYPLSKVDLTNRKEFLRISHYTNYQPLWARENIQKSDKIQETA